MKINLISSIILSIVSNYSYACTYQEVQDKMLYFENLIQTYNELSQTPAKTSAKSNMDKQQLALRIIAMEEASAKVAILLSEEFTTLTNIKSDSPITPEVCQQYDTLIKRYGTYKESILTKEQ